MSAPLHLIAIETYGSQRVRAPASGAIAKLTEGMVSAFKIGYSTVGRAVLLDLYGSRALDVTSKHASYHYVSLEGDVSAHNGYLLLALTEEEFERVKQITRVHPSRRTGIFWWHENQWWHFPYKDEGDFSRAMNRTGPSIDPTRYRVVSPSSGEKVSAVEGIRAEYSQHSPHEPGWWWLTGETYPHRDLLKLKGCRWSQKRKAWYFQGATLPEAIQRLVHATPVVTPLLPPDLTAAIEQTLIEDDAAEARAKVSITPTHTFGELRYRFTLGQTVYLASNVRVTVDQKLRMDTPGTIIRRYVYKKTPDYRHEFAYDVDFGAHGVHSVFQDNLDSQPQNLRGIERDETVMLMFGTSAEKAFLANIERRQRIPQDYTVLDEINTNAALPPGSSAELAQRAMQDTLAITEPPVSDEIIEEVPPEPTIRVLPPPVLTDDTTDSIAVAVRTTPREARQTVAMMTPPRDKRQWIEQAAVGELTGSITGNVWCYGYALHGGVLLYLNMGGPRMALEAIRAKLSKGDVVSLVPPDAPAIELSAGETEGKPNTGQYTAYLNTMPEAKFTSAILVHAALQPTSRHAFTGVFRTSEAQATAKVHHLVQALVTIPVFAIWADYLMDAGQRAGLIRPSFPRGGGIDLMIVERDAKAWTRLVTGGLANGVIALPQMTVK